MKKAYFAYLLLAACIRAQAQQDTIVLDEPIISATRTEGRRSATAQHVQTLNQRQIAQLNAQTTADLAQFSGAVYVQRSQQGGGSPVMRGFEASRVLLVIDGVRMNNAIYRSGHLQNIISVDNAALSRIEMLFGPASNMYGSDALGGVIYMATRDPELSEDGRATTRVGAFARYGSANQEKTAHLDLSVGGSRFGVFTSLTYSDFGDLRMGRNKRFGNLFGERPFYVERRDGRDTLIANPDPLIQRPSGYRQYDGMVKALWRPNARHSHTLNLQHSGASQIPRYDRLTDLAATGLRFAEWYYEPQSRTMAAYTWRGCELGWFDQAQATLSVQQLAEGRVNRRFGNNNLQRRVDTVNVWGFTLDAQRRLSGAHLLQAGIDAQYNAVHARAERVNIATGQVMGLDTRYPDGGSAMYSAAVYASHRWSAQGERWRLSEGFRVGVAGLDALFRDKRFFEFPFDRVRQRNLTWSVGADATYALNSHWQLKMGASTGFRVPNVDDLGKVFDSAPGLLIVPNPDLKPEKTLSPELGLVWRRPSGLRWESTLWHTLFLDAITVQPFRFDGRDSLLYDGVLSQVAANQNARRARMWGFQSYLDAPIGAHWGLFLSGGYTYGQIVSAGEEGPLDHIPPLYGRVGGRWTRGQFGAQAFAVFNGRKPIERYNLTGEDNQRYAPAEGMPAWMTFHLRAEYRLPVGLMIQAGADNLLDTQYRTFASGINGPGRHVFVTLRYAPVW
ncbi:MAG: TonB-dependent receptor plug domain-containing protein [Saprospiraceae bacterium]